jgi:superfamily II DNA or RNA helicase
LLDTKNKPKVNIQILDRSKNDAPIDIESVLRAVIALQKTGTIELNDTQKSELLLMQEIYKNSKFNRQNCRHELLPNKMDKIFSLLSKAEEVIDSETKQKITFLDQIWELTLSVNVSLVGNVLLSLHWKRPEPEDVYPLEEVFYYSRNLKWGRYKNVIVPLDTALSVLPHYLTKSTFTDIRDADGGKFVYEELPKLKKLMKVEISETLEKLTLERKPPVNVLTLDADEDNALKASLEFEYDGVRVPYGKLAEKTPYVTIKKPDEDLIFWIKRNLSHEENAYKMLLSMKFAPMQTNNLQLDPDSAIDFYNFYMPHSGDEWKMIEANDLSKLKVFSEPLKIIAGLDFGESVDSFELGLKCMAGDQEITIEEIQKKLHLGHKYFQLDQKGYVEVPATKLLLFNKTLNNCDAQIMEDNRFLIKTFRAGIVAELIEQGIVLNMSQKFEQFWTQISTFNTMEEIEQPEGINATFREYQLKGLNWLWFIYTYGLNGILADDMGLGKTLQALALIQKAKNEEGSMPTLVICPTSVVFNWEAEVQKFTPELKVLNLTGAERKSSFAKIKNHDIVITSYALIRRDIEELKKHEFRTVILDESQNIKNYESLTAQCTKQLKTGHRFALSGTPIENRLSELWSVFDFLMPGFLYDLNEFNYRFVNPIVDKADKTVESRLKKQIYPFILRRLKRDVAKDLPDKVENVAYCKLTPDQKDFYLEVLDSTREELFQSIAQNGIEKSRLSIFAALLRLRQICCHPRLYDKEGIKNINESGKFEHLKEMLEEIISEGHRVLLFSQFVNMLDIIKEWFDRVGIKYEYLTGATKDRKEKVDRFNNDESVSVFLISLKAGGTGLNLTGADYVIHYDPWWNPAVEDQATDRAYRIGQTKKVFVYRFITKGTVEEKIQKLKERKRNLVDSVISVDREIGKSLSYEDIKDILSPDL